MRLFSLPAFEQTTQPHADKPPQTQQPRTACAALVWRPSDTNRRPSAECVRTGSQDKELHASKSRNPGYGCTYTHGHADTPISWDMFAPTERPARLASRATVSPSVRFSMWLWRTTHALLGKCGASVAMLIAATGDGDSDSGAGKPKFSVLLCVWYCYVCIPK